MGFDGVEEEITGLREKWVNVEGEGIEVRTERVGREERIAFDGRDGGWFFKGSRWRWRRQLVQECGEEVRVVYLDGQLNEDILVSKVGFL